MTTKNFTSPFKPLLVAFTVISLLLANAANAQLNKQLSDKLNKVFTEKSQQFGMRGVSAAIVFPDSTVWEATYGNAGTKPLNTDMLFEMGSNTKTLTMALILLLEEEGKLSIDDTVYKHLSPLKNISNGITIKQLLYHTSGLYSYTNHPDFTSELNTGNPAKIFNIDSILAKYVNAPESTPGVKWDYSNTNFLLLGKIIEKVTGKPYHVVMREKLLDPLGLKHTYLAEYENHTEEKAETWLLTTTGGVIYDTTRYRNFLSAAWAAGGIVSTAEDLAKWAKLLYSNKVFTKNESYKKMNTLLNINGQTIQFGLSTFFRTYKGNVYVGHGGTTLQHSEMEFAPKLDYSCVVVANEQGTSQEIAAIKRALYDVMEGELPLALSTQQVVAAAPQFKAYPNPSNTSINIVPNNTTSSFTVKVYNTNGQQVFAQQGEMGTFRLQKLDIGEGMFIAEVIEDNNTVSRKRIIFY